MLKVAFVCTGNTCRSPMAEYILKDLLVKIGEPINDYNIYSLGIMATPGDSASVSSIEVMELIGIDITNHKSKRVNPENIQADILITMGKSHKQFLQQNTSNPHIYMLNQYANQSEKDIFDPYLGDIYEYIQVRDEIYSSIKLIVNKIRDLKNKKMEEK